MKRSLLVFSMIMLGSLAFSQIAGGIEKRDRQRRGGKHFGENRRDAIYSHSQSSYKPFGWYINPGATYMVGHSAEDQSDGSELTPSGLPGYYVEGGFAFLMKRIRKTIHYFDVGLGVKHFGGTEKFKTTSVTERGHFNFGSAFFRGAMHNCWQLNMYNFIDQSIGVNFDYRIYGGKADDTYSHSSTMHPNPSKMTLQLNYSFGWGIKIRDGFFIIPTVQTPFLSFFPDGLHPSLEWFSSKYHPTIFTVKFGWLFRKKGCPKVYDNGEGKKQSDQYQMQ